MLNTVELSTVNGDVVKPPLSSIGEGRTDRGWPSGVSGVYGGGGDGMAAMKTHL